MTQVPATDTFGRQHVGRLFRGELEKVLSHQPSELADLTVRSRRGRAVQIPVMLPPPLSQGFIMDVSQPTLMRMDNPVGLLNTGTTILVSYGPEEESSVGEDLRAGRGCFVYLASPGRWRIFQTLAPLTATVNWRVFEGVSAEEWAAIQSSTTTSFQMTYADIVLAAATAATLLPAGETRTFGVLQAVISNNGANPAFVSVGGNPSAVSGIPLAAGGTIVIPVGFPLQATLRGFSVLGTTLTVQLTFLDIAVP